MKNVILLIKAMFLNMFRSEHKKKKQLNNFVGMFISGGIFGLLFVFYTLMLGPIFYSYGLAAEFLTFLFIASQVVILLFGTVFMVNVMFFGKDAEFLLYLPVKPTEIYAAKMLFCYLCELMMTAFVLGVSGVAFGIACGLPFYFYPLLAVAILFVPFIPLVAASLLCVPIMYFMSFFKNKSALGMVVLTVFFGALIFGYMAVVTSIPQSIADGEQIILPAEEIRQSMQYIIPNISMAKIVTGTSSDYLTDIGYTLLATLGIFGITLLISNFTFKRSISAQLESPSGKTDTPISFEQKSPVKSFYIKDLKELVRNTGFAFYCFFQVIMAPIMILFISISMPAQAAEEGMSLVVLEGMAFFMTILMVSGLNYTALSSISREGPNFYMSKTLPAPYRLQAKAKMLLADTVLLAGIVMCYIVCVAAININIFQALLFSGFALIFGNALNHYMLYSDAKNPKLDWESITMAIKNSKAALLSMLMSMGCALLFISAYILIQILLTGIMQIMGYAVMWVVFYGAALALNVGFRKQCYNNIERLIMQIE